MTSWHTGPLLALDTETTGPNPDTARIVTAYAAHITNTGDLPLSWAWLADPGIDIPPGATAVHGVTSEHAQANGRPAAEVVGEIVATLAIAVVAGFPVIGHNVVFDLTVIDRECRRHRIPLPDWDRLLVIDTLVLDKHVWPYRPGSRKLADVAEQYGVPIRGDAHNAAADALAAARVGHRIATIGTTPTEDRDERHAEWKWGKPTQRFEDAVGDAVTLHNQQRRWAALQAESLEQYFAKLAKREGRDPETVDGTWPIRQLPPNWDPTTTDPIEVTA